VYTGSGYSISHDGEKLYAVYNKTTASVTYYERITNKSEVTSGGVYIIVSTGGRAVTTSYRGKFDGSHVFEGTTGITISGNYISSVVSASAVEWTYDGTRFRGNNGTYLTYNGSESRYYYYVENTTGPIFQLNEHDDESYYLGTSGNNFDEPQSISSPLYLWAVPHLLLLHI
jgi:hypothetical protein